MVSKIVTAVSRPARIKWYLLVALVVFALGIFAGGVFGAADPEATDETMTGLADRVDPMWEGDTLAMALGIFVNNVTVACVLWVGGLLVVPGLFIIGYNGAVIGMMFAWAADLMGPIAIPVVVIGILPHGILEIPATLLALALGLRAVHVILLVALGRVGIREGGNVLMVSAAAFVAVVVPMLFAAAFIEAYFTGWLLGLAVGV